MSTATATPPSSGFADVVANLSGLPPDKGPTKEPAGGNPPPAAPNNEPPKDTPQPPREPVKEPVKQPEPKGEDTRLNPNLDEPAPPKPKDTPPPTDGDPMEIPADYLKGMTTKAAEKARETWRSIKTSEAKAIEDLTSAQSELAAAKKQLEESSKGGDEVARLKQENEDLQKRLGEFEGEIAVTRVEATPKYKEQVSGPIKASEQSTKELATKYDISEAKLLDALREPDKGKRADLLSELSADFKSYDQRTLFDAADAYARATQAGEELRSKAGEKLTEMERQAQQNAERMAAENIAGFRKAAGAEWKALQERHPELRPSEILPTDSDEAKAKKQRWNDYLGTIQQDVEALDVNELPVTEVAKMRAASLALKEITAVSNHYRSQAKERGEKIRELEERLADYQQTEPGAGAGKTTKEIAESGKKFADLPEGI